jgi:hypothetical protein
LGVGSLAVINSFFPCRQRYRNFAWLNSYSKLLVAPKALKLTLINKKFGTSEKMFKNLNRQRAVLEQERQNTEHFLEKVILDIQ